MSFKDIEHVVQVLDLLLDIDANSKKEKLSNFFSRYRLLIDFTRRKEHMPIFRPTINEMINWKELVKIASELRDKIEIFTFQQYESKALKFPEIVKTFNQFFSMLKSHKEDESVVEVFTTNYDNVIEDYCRESKKNCKLTVLNHAVASSSGKNGEKYYLTKLHGSLDWLIDRRTDNIVVSITQHKVPKNSERWKRNEYILFGTKTRIGEKLYSDLFKSFENSLSRTEVCIVVGFSFRDEHINKIINQAMNENKSLRLIIVSRAPKSTVKNLVHKRRFLKKFIKEKRIIPLRCSFGTKKALKMIDDALSEIP